MKGLLRVGFATAGVALTACQGTISSPGSDVGDQNGSSSASSGGDAARGGSTGAGSEPGSGNGGSSASSGSSSGSSSGGAAAGGQPGVIGTGGTTVAVDCKTGTHGALSRVRRLTGAEYANAISDLFNLAPSAKYPGTYGNSVTGYSTEADISVVGEQGVEQILYAAEEVALKLEPQIAKLLPCASKADDACAGTFLDTYGRRAFRRALAADEKQTLLAVYQAERADAATFSEAIAVMASQMLQMPAFLYVIEGAAPAGKDRALTGVELASRLAFHFWNSLPDDTLLDAAQKLTTKAAVLEQAKRLFADARSDRAFKRFFREWTETTQLTATAKDQTAFPYANEAFMASVNESFDRFATGQVRSSGTLESLLRSNSTFVDANLAKFYGLPAVSTWTSVTLPADRYSGIATQPAMLASLAHAADTSYVFRGRFVRKRMLCQEFGSPPANAQSEFAAIQKPTNPTAKEVASAVQSRALCGGCHVAIDPGGLAFEHFDGMGKYREQYASGKAIDSSGTLNAVSTGSVTFTDPVDMMAQLSALPETERCFATQVFRYAASRRDAGEDTCAIQQIASSLSASDGRLDQAFIEAAQTDAFMYRRGE